MWQLDFTEFETTAGGTWRLAGCRDHWSKYELGWHVSPTANQHDAIAAIELAMAEAQRLAGAPNSARRVRTIRTAAAFSSSEYRRVVGLPGGCSLGMTPSSFPRSGASTGPRASQMEFLESGGDGKPLQVGWAAQSALFVLDLALAGATGPPTVLEGRYGIFRSFAGSPLPTDLDPWEDHAILNVATKPYPVCHGIHDPADLWREMAAELRGQGIDPVDDVEELTCVVSGFTARLTLEPIEAKRRPRTSHQARFSLPYCLARIALDGDLDVAGLAPDAVRDPRAARFADRVTYEVNEAGVAPETTRTRLRLRTTGGAVVEGELQRSLTSRSDLFGPEDLRSKFVGNVAPRTENGTAERGLAAAEALYGSNSATPFLDWLATGAAG